MRRLVAYSQEELARLGGKVGPSLPGERVSAQRNPRPSATPVTVPRTNHLPKRRPLVAVQRLPEA